MDEEDYQNLRGDYLTKFLAFKGISNFCPACGEPKMMNAVNSAGGANAPLDAPLFVSHMNSVHPPFNSAPFFSQICSNCGYLRFFYAALVKQSIEGEISDA